MVGIRFKMIIYLFKMIASMPFILFSKSSNKYLHRLVDILHRLIVLLEEKLRKQAAFSNRIWREGHSKYILSDSTPWQKIELPRCNIPGMITEEEKKYYYNLDKFYNSFGEVVELGPWLGCSTFYILKGLKKNKLFKNKKLFVFDDFIWRSAWMDEHYPDDDKPGNHKSFLPLFEKYTGSLKEDMIINECRISPGHELEECGVRVNPYLSHDNSKIENISWNGAPVELMIVDCGRTLDINSAWYRVFSGSFIPGKTLIVLQDWQTHKEVPVKWYNQLKQFTDSIKDEIELVHELRSGCTATFLYKGAGRK